MNRGAASDEYEGIPSWHVTVRFEGKLSGSETSAILIYCSDSKTKIKQRIKELIIRIRWET
jgi:hypothetical protein